jgi:hypothetical protein
MDPIGYSGHMSELDFPRLLAAMDRRRQIRMSEEVVEKVDRMWKELGLPGSGRSIWE